METAFESFDIALENAFAYLSAPELAAAALAFPAYKDVARLDSLWRAHVERRWAGKQRHCVVALKADDISNAGTAGSTGDAGADRWFARFVAAEADARRRRITAEELCGTAWVFSDGLQRPRFRPNGELHMELYPVMRWALRQNGSVMIQNFPEHHVDRTEDWGWRIHNRNVDFVSVDRPPFDTSPLPPDATEAEVVNRVSTLLAAAETDGRKVGPVLLD